MTLDIIVATRNRADRLRLLLESLQHAARPTDLGVRVLVVDNNSTDHTPVVVKAFPPIHGAVPVYLHETRPGKSHALNLAIAHATADLIGLLDDDERVDIGWLAAVADCFRDQSVAFVSGPYKPDWGAPPPPWLPRSHPGVIGWIESGNQTLEYGAGYQGMMMAGNAVIRTDWVRRVGPFNPMLGRIGNKPTVGEDADYHERLVAAGARGLYLPQLVIYHYVPPERLTKSYFRQWVFYHGVSVAHINRLRPQRVKHVLGVPRYLIGNAVRGARGVITSLLSRRGDAETRFTHELAIWDLWGFVYGRLQRISS
jgi:GT2 family glycosyltransferase